MAATTDITVGTLKNFLEALDCGPFHETIANQIVNSSRRQQDALNTSAKAFINNAIPIMQQNPQTWLDTAKTNEDLVHSLDVIITAMGYKGLTQLQLQPATSEITPLVISPQAKEVSIQAVSGDSRDMQVKRYLVETINAQMPGENSRHKQAVLNAILADELGTVLGNAQESAMRHGHENFRGTETENILNRTIGNYIKAHSGEIIQQYEHAQDDRRLRNFLAKNHVASQILDEMMDRINTERGANPNKTLRDDLLATMGKHISPEGEETSLLDKKNARNEIGFREKISNVLKGLEKDCERSYNAGHRFQPLAYSGSETRIAHKIIRSMAERTTENATVRDHLIGEALADDNIRKHVLHGIQNPDQRQTTLQSIETVFSERASALEGGYKNPPAAIIPLEESHHISLGQQLKRVAAAVIAAVR